MTSTEPRAAPAEASTDGPGTLRSGSRGRDLVRRTVSFAVVAVAFVVAYALAPVWLVLAVVVDLATGRAGRWSTLRLVLFGLGYLALTLSALLAGIGIWFLAGFGRRMNDDRWYAVNQRIQFWWVDRNQAMLRRTIGLRWHIDGVDELTPGPVVILVRHVSFADAVFGAGTLPQSGGLRARVVLMKELRVEPNIDVFADRMLHHFVDRVATRGQLDAIGRLMTARPLRSDSAGLIFPEGGLANDAKRERILAKLTETDPARAERVGGMRYLLPVRPGGSKALLDAAPEADLVLCGHAGYEGLQGVRQAWRNVPLRFGVEARVWRFARTELPEDPDAFIEWLDHRWAEIDQWIGDVHEERGSMPS